MMERPQSKDFMGGNWGRGIVKQCFEYSKWLVKKSSKW
jgi:hypothetical protein